MAQGETIYAKAGCPFTFRFVLFVNDVDTLSNYTVRVAQAGELPTTPFARSWKRQLERKRVFRP